MGLGFGGGSALLFLERLEITAWMEDMVDDVAESTAAGSDSRLTRAGAGLGGVDVTRATTAGGDTPVAGFAALADDLLLEGTLSGLLGDVARGRADIALATAASVGDLGIEGMRESREIRKK